MQMLSPLLVAMFALCCAKAYAVEPCSGQTPVKAAEAFYKAHKDFAIEDPKRLHGQVTKRFYEALAFEHRCKVGEICAIDFDLWTGAQDGNIQKPITFQLASGNGNTALVNMRYTFALDRLRSKSQAAKIQVERGATEKCWLIADVLSPDGISAIRTIEEFRAKYGRQL